MDPSTTAGLTGLEGVAGQPNIAGGAGLLNQFLGPQGGLPTALNTLQSTAAGDMVGVNPALQEAFELNRQDREASLLNRFAAAGGAGLNPAVARAITRANAQAELPLIAQDISTQQARQQQAAQFLPGLFGTLGNVATFAPGLQLQAGQTREAFERANRAAELQRALAEQRNRLAAAGSFGGMTGGGTNVTTAPGASTLGQVVGLGAQLGGAALSGPMGGQVGRAVSGLFGAGTPTPVVSGSVQRFPQIDAAGRILGGI